jgi:hypothetical protein
VRDNYLKPSIFLISFHYQFPVIDSVLTLPDYLRNARNIEHILALARACRAERIAHRVAAEYRVDVCTLQLNLFQEAADCLLVSAGMASSHDNNTTATSLKMVRPRPAGEYAGTNGAAERCELELEQLGLEVSRCTIRLEALRREVSQAELEVLEVDRGIAALLGLIGQTGISFKYLGPMDAGQPGRSRVHRHGAYDSDSETSLPIAPD